MERRAIGTVAALYRHPVKSMRGEAVASLPLAWHGVEGDRRYAWVKTGSLSRFPWVTARDLPELIRYAPYLADPADPKRAPVRVRTPAGADLPIESEALRAEIEGKLGLPIHLMQVSRGAPDGAGISVMSLATLRALGARAGRDLDPRRFRQNVLIGPLDETTAADALAAERRWLGRLLVFGDGADAPGVRINRPDPRCMIVNLDPESAVQDPAVLRAVTELGDGRAGLYGSTERLGTIEVGAPVYLA